MGCITYTSFFEKTGNDKRVFAFSAGRGCHGTEPGIDAREVGIELPNVPTPALVGGRLGREAVFIPRQTHSVNVAWTDVPGEVPDTDAAITCTRGLCVAVKTADCIPVLLYDDRQRLVAAVHAGWRGTVGRIVEKTIREMKSRGEDLQAIIGPGISLDAFEVGDEVYEAFAEAEFPMDSIAKRYPIIVSSSEVSTMNEEIGTMNSQKWHLNLWEANRWLLEQQGVKQIHTAGICTFTHLDEFYSARRETIKTGRNINGIMLL